LRRVLAEQLSVQLGQQLLWRTAPAQAVIGQTAVLKAPPTATRCPRRRFDGGRALRERQRDHDLMVTPRPSPIDHRLRSS
jgi:hypothetical protein